MPAGTRSWRGICLWLLPNNQNVPLCQAGKGVEFLRQGAEAAGDADDLPAVATFVFQLAGIVTILAAGREPSGYASRVSPPDGSRRTATICAAVWRGSIPHAAFQIRRPSPPEQPVPAACRGVRCRMRKDRGRGSGGSRERRESRGDRSRLEKVSSLLLSTFSNLLLYFLTPVGVKKWINAKSCRQRQVALPTGVDPSGRALVLRRLGGRSSC